ncbi:expressed unknown protein [Ectocarpus siliculosus]|uniref:Uncharacterized protein n=1 Tax=Ectocarpus siliculosus TaxID=2880 RepID=D7FMN0_ECTSI|nr:expressed unknown protein [Ectocarpus siliculosus]|eukprot:CBJ25927.1 expressed unknown protein [Ectocarpus siliculosus]
MLLLDSVRFVWHSHCWCLSKNRYVVRIEREDDGVIISMQMVSGVSVFLLEHL